jgi:hypothetical protein
MKTSILRTVALVLTAAAGQASALDATALLKAADG